MVEPDTYTFFTNFPDIYPALHIFTSNFVQNLHICKNSANLSYEEAAGRKEKKIAF